MKERVTDVLAVAGLTAPWTLAEIQTGLSILVAALSALWLIRQIYVSFRK